ncbi:MAG: TMEM165/GDT1 family protein [Streptosporangiaceae bacterium]
MVFLGEFGDLTQVAIVNLAARYHDPLAVGTGAVVPLWVADPAAPRQAPADGAGRNVTRPRGPGGNASEMKNSDGQSTAFFRPRCATAIEKSTNRHSAAARL